MNYLLDTCVVSELMKKAPNPKVVSWIRIQAEESMYLSVLTLGEIQRGITRHPDAANRLRLQQWLHTALLWGEVQAQLEAAGTPMAAVDGLLSATARLTGLTLVTRNTSDMKDPEVPLLDPWSS